MTSDHAALLASTRPVSEPMGDDAEDERLLREMLNEATDYVASQRWCGEIVDRYFGDGIGGIVAIFLFRIVPRGEADEVIWVITGDLPSAYIDTESASDPVAALEVYCDVMAAWVDAVRDSTDLSEVFPVDVEPTLEHADILATRLEQLRVHILPQLRRSP